MGRPRGSPKPKSSSDILCSWGFLAVNFYSTSLREVLCRFILSRLVFYLSPVLLHFYDVRAWVYFQVSGQVSNLVTPRSQPSQLAPVTSLGRSVAGCGQRMLRSYQWIGGGEILYFASPGHLLSDKFANLT